MSGIKRRGIAWTDEETLSLLNLWQKQKIEDPKVYHTIYRILALEMQQIGYQKTPDQCRIKMHTLRRSYRASQINLNEQGMPRSPCKHFDILNKIILSRPVSPAMKIYDNMKHNFVDSENSEINDSDFDFEIRNINVQGIDERTTRVIKQEALSPNSNGKDYDLFVSISESTNLNRRRTTSEADSLFLADDISSKQYTDNYSDGKIISNSSITHLVPVENGCSRRQITPIDTNTSTPGVSKPTYEEPQNDTNFTDRRTGKKRRIESMPSFLDAIPKSSEGIIERYLELEGKKIDLERERIEIEKQKMVIDERIRQDDREHQMNMLQLIIRHSLHHGEGEPHSSEPPPVQVVFSLNHGTTKL